jgi:hypothetical protein
MSISLCRYLHNPGQHSVQSVLANNQQAVGSSPAAPTYLPPLPLAPTSCAHQVVFNDDVRGRSV